MLRLFKQLPLLIRVVVFLALAVFLLAAGTLVWYVTMEPNIDTDADIEANM